MGVLNLDLASFSVFVFGLAARPSKLSLRAPFVDLILAIVEPNLGLLLPYSFFAVGLESEFWIVGHFSIMQMLVQHFGNHTVDSFLRSPWVIM